MADNNQDDVKISIRPPKFSGEKKEWEYYKVAMTTYLSTAGLGDILTRGEEVVRDDHDWPEGTEQGVIDAGRRLQKINRKAAGVLFQSLVNNTPEGKRAVAVAKPHFKPELGYTPGKFHSAWAALTHWFEVVKKRNVDEVRDSFYSMKMGENEQPSEFILKAQEKQDELERGGYTVDHRGFVDRILKALPTDERGVGPYSTKASAWKDKLDAADDATVETEVSIVELTESLEKVYETIKASGKKSRKKGNSEMVFYAGGTTKRCHNCGKVGHLRDKCPQRKSTKGDGRKGKPFQSNRSNQQKKFEGKCFHCGKVGHRKEDCWALQKGQAKQGEQANAAREGKREYADAVFTGIEEIDVEPKCYVIEDVGEDPEEWVKEDVDLPSQW